MRKTSFESQKSQHIDDPVIGIHLQHDLAVQMHCSHYFQHYKSYLQFLRFIIIIAG